MKNKIIPLKAFLGKPLELKTGNVYYEKELIEACKKYEGQFSRSGCSCVNVEFGTYSNQFKLISPFGEADEIKFVGIDRCIAPEILDLWERGIETIESCCGHNKAPAYIAVRECHEKQMEELGYKRSPDYPHVFLSKTIIYQSQQTNREGEKDERKKRMREQATAVFELTKGFTGEPTNNATKAALEMAGYVLELTN